MERQGRLARALRLLPADVAGCDLAREQSAALKARLVAELDQNPPEFKVALARARELRAQKQHQQAQLWLDRGLRRAEKLVGTRAKIEVLVWSPRSWSKDKTLAAGWCGGPCVASIQDSVVWQFSGPEDSPGGSLSLLSPDGKTFTTAGIRDSGGTLAVWDVSLRKLLARFSKVSRDDLVRFNEDGSLLAFFAGNAVNVLDTKARPVPEPILIPLQKEGAADEGREANIESIAFSPDNQFLVLTQMQPGSSSFGVIFWDTKSRKIHARIDGIPQATQLSGFFSQFSPDGSEFAWIEEGKIGRFHLKTKRRLPSLGNTSSCLPTTFAYHPSRSRMAIGTVGVGACTQELSGKTPRVVVPRGPECEFAGCDAGQIWWSSDDKLLGIRKDNGTATDDYYEISSGRLVKKLTPEPLATRHVDLPVGSELHPERIHSLLLSDESPQVLEIFGATGAKKVPLSGQAPSALDYPETSFHMRVRAGPDRVPLLEVAHENVTRGFVLTEGAWRPLPLPPSSRPEMVEHAEVLPGSQQIVVLQRDARGVRAPKAPPGPETKRLVWLRFPSGEEVAPSLPIEATELSLQGVSGRFSLLQSSSSVMLVDNESHKILSETASRKGDTFFLVGADLLAVVSHDKSVELRSLPEGAVVETLLLGGDFLTSSPSGRWLVAFHEQDPGLALWDRKNKRSHSLPTSDRSLLGFSDDERYFFTTGTSTTAWDTSTLRPVAEIFTYGDATFALSPGGEIEVFGNLREAHQRLSCHIGDTFYPLDLCLDALLSPGLLARSFSKATSTPSP